MRAVRALGWPAAAQESRTPSNLGVHAYDGDAQVAHSHNFSLLTTNYFGPGYETDVFDWDVDAHPEEYGAGRARAITAAGTLSAGSGHRDVLPHSRTRTFSREPTAYAASINLLVHPPEEDLRDQHYFDVQRQRVVMPGGLGNDRRIQLIQMAWALGDPAIVPHLSRDPPDAARCRGRAPGAVGDARLFVAERFDRVGAAQTLSQAGKIPKKMPMVAEKPKPRAKDHHGRETGKPEAGAPRRPMALPQDARGFRRRRSGTRLRSGTATGFAAARAKRLADADSRVRSVTEIS